ncbi:P10 [Avian orthoreovirus]|uniref:p10 n=2 Tax=Avian orthoreovirus TaxID=38170 RepID=A7J366_9REOV|nr:membrane fusion protein p10 [Avian reovirus strain S1133]ABI97293.1 p10 [Avian orthoreovirus]AIS22935.1 P10 protein [Avian orthoreovirus]AJA90924.1 P10 [Avian orthoreovirus]UHU35242.1 membrane fusion protein p10 [Avian orthoreovirus]
MLRMPPGSCNGATAVFGNVHCQAAQNTAGGDLQATSSIIAYWPYLAAGGGFLLIVIIFALLYCCKAKIKADAARSVFHRELVALSSGKHNAMAPPYDV